MFNSEIAVLIGLCGLFLGIVFMALFSTTTERSGYNKN